MIITGIDPGPESSAYVSWDGAKIVAHGEKTNRDLLDSVNLQMQFGVAPDVVVIEQIRGFGVLAGDKLFDTCFWSGRFYQAWGEGLCHMLPRKKAIAHLCGTGARGGDRFVREALIARIGEQGSRKQPGPTFGISGHKWSALAVAVTYSDLYEVDTEKETHAETSKTARD
jgi:hypothetical protein